MIEKRFTTNNGVFYTDNETGWEFQSYGEVVDLLNELNDENKELKDKNSQLQETLAFRSNQLALMERLVD